MARIILIIPNLDFGGAQLSFRKLSDDLSKENEVLNVVFNEEGMISSQFKSTLRSLGVRKGRWIGEKFFRFIQRLIRFKKLKNEFKPDISISFLEGADYVNILTKGKEKVVISVRGSKKHDENISGVLGFFRLYFFIPILYNSASAIVVVNDGIGRELISLGVKKTKIHKIPNYYNVEKLRIFGAEDCDIGGFNEIRSFTIGTFGRLAVEKGFHHLIRVCNLLDDSFCLIIMGSGPYSTKLLQICKELDIRYYSKEESNSDMNSAKIIFLGYQKNPLKIISRCDLFALASSAEGFPNALMESMACGVPSLATDCPNGPREILSAKTNTEPLSLARAEFSDYGILMPTFDGILSEKYLVWKQTIEMIKSSPLLRKEYAQKARNRVEDFSREKILEQWDHLIKN